MESFLDDTKVHFIYKDNKGGETEHIKTKTRALRT